MKSRTRTTFTFLTAIIGMSTGLGCATQTNRAATTESPAPSVPSAPAPAEHQSSKTSKTMANLESTAQNTTQFVYNIPQGAPEGEFKIIAVGWTELRTHSDESTHLPALHLRIVAKRKQGDLPSQQDWSLDTRLQQIRFSGSDDIIRPLFVYSQSSNLPYVRLADDEEATIELYYPLPPPLALAAHKVPLPKFELRWTLLTSLQSVSETTDLVELYAEKPTTSVYPRLTNRNSLQRRNASRAADLKREPAFASMDGYWWQDPFGEVPPAFSTIGIW